LPDPAADPALLRPLPDVVREAAGEAAALLKTELQLLDLETRDNVKAYGRATGEVVVGLFLALVALVFLMAAGVVGLAALIGLGWAFFVAAGIAALLAWLAVSAGRRNLAGKSLLPKAGLARLSADLDRLAMRAEAVRGRVQRRTGLGDGHG
jgi:hypothetical protein